MNAIIDLSRLLAEADRLHQAAARPDVLSTELEQRYLTWYQACTVLLPDDLRTQFVSFYEPGTPNKPMISDLFRAVNTPAPTTELVESSPPVSVRQSWGFHRSLFQ